MSEEFCFFVIKRFDYILSVTIITFVIKKNIKTFSRFNFFHLILLI